MTLRLGSVVIRVDDLDAQAAFWSAALGYEAHRLDHDYIVLRPPGGGGPTLSLDRVRSERQIPPRIHLDLHATDQPAEVDRLLALGASRVHWAKRPADADYVILEDPEGNRFCVVDARPG